MHRKPSSTIGEPRLPAPLYAPQKKLGDLEATLHFWFPVIAHRLVRPAGFDIVCGPKPTHFENPGGTVFHGTPSRPIS